MMVLTGFSTNLVDDFPGLKVSGDHKYLFQGLTWTSGDGDVHVFRREVVVVA